MRLRIEEALVKGSDYVRSALVCATTAVLSGCGALPLNLSKGQGDMPPIGSPGASQRSAGIAAPASSSYQLLYSFGGGADGVNPYAGLINVHGTLYGTTYGGGANGYGTVFNVTTTGKEKVLYSFSGGSADGAAPYGGLVDVNGTLYGTTFYGGAHGYGTYYPGGTVFSVRRSGAEKVLYSFGGSSADAFGPYADLIDVNGKLYGTTYDGGAYYQGTVFSVTTTGTEKVLHSFGYGYDGSQPQAGLINVKGVLYGTTPIGGANGIGTVFSLTRSGAEKVTHSFTGRPDGENPDAALINVKGTLYGTTSTGGRYYAGTVFSITATGKEKMLYSFCSRHKCADGSGPEAGLINVSGTLYGTTIYGGGTAQCGSIGCGTVFRITTAGEEKVLYSFGSRSADGANPYAGLINVNGTLYGTTTAGGAYGSGTVFALTP
ncbi:MAG: choice-of-anchor tandem repeat GloVer-containing protein [Candidatus Cybelea sp.]